MPRTSHVLISAILLALTAAPSWAQVLRGTVTDADNSPLEGVLITVTSEEQTGFRETMTTNRKGQFTLRFQKNQTQFKYEFLFEKIGFQSFTQQISPSATRMTRETFVMEPGETQQVKSHGDLSAVVTGADNEAIAAFNAGLTAQRDGDLDTARTKLEEAVAADASLGPARVALAQVQLDQKDYEAALTSADAALGLDTARTEGLRVKYQALRALGRTEEAEAISAELASAEDAAASARRFYNEGGEAFKVKDYDTALDRFRKAAEADPSLTDAHHAVATLELAKGNHEAAATSAKRALELGSEKLETLRVLYDAYDALGRIDELTEIAPRLAAVDPEFGGAKLVEQAAELWNGGQTEKAVIMARQALAIDPEIAKAHYFLGLDHLSKGNNPEAKAALEKFIELAPEDSEAPTAKEMLTYIQ